MKSITGIRWLNFFLADVRDGIGPFLNVYLLSQHHWQPADIGIAVAVSLIASVIFQTPAGAFIDRSRYKRIAIILAALMMMISSIALIVSTNYYVVIVAQFLMGSASTIFAPAISALTLGIAGYRSLDYQISRNETFNHAGNVIGALLAGILSYFINGEWIFILNAILAVLAIVSTLQIKERDIDHRLARGAEVIKNQKQTTSLGKLFSNRQLMVFSVSVILFHFANAAMLPLAGQFLSIGNARSSSLLIAGCILIAQFVMVPVARFAGSLTMNGRRPALIIAFAVLLLRGALYNFSKDSYFIMGLQILDGIAAGIMGVVSILVIADLTRGQGVFNLAQGVITTAIGIGAAASNILAGYSVQYFGYGFAFTSLSVIALAALTLLTLFFKESLSTNDISQ